MPASPAYPFQRYALLMFWGFVAATLGAKTNANWPQFRGENASGLDTNTPAPITWDLATARNVAWRTPIPGLAHASPIVWNQRVYVITAVQPGKADLKVGLYGDIKSADDQVEHEWRILALDRNSGEVVWDKLGHKAVPRVKRHTKASHANSTPATDGRNIVAFFGSEGLFCFDLEGNLVWKKDLGPMDSGYFQVKSAQWGFASSPIIHQGAVIAQVDVQTNSFLAAYSIIDGKELWRTPRADVPTWSTPAIAKVGERTRILVNGWHHTGGYDFESGREIWKLSGGGDIPVPTPIVSHVHGLAYFTSAHGRFRPMRAIRLEATGDITPADPGATNSAIVWTHARQGNYMQTPIAAGDAVFGCSDSGLVTCFDARSGSVRYSERLVQGGQGFSASPVSDGRSLYFSSEMGEVFVVPVGDKFSITATNSVGETCMATPALTDGMLLFRTRGHLLAVRQKNP